jgi:VanZ family protein
MQKKKWWLVFTFIWLIIIYVMTEMPYFNGESTSTAIEKTIDKTETIQKKIIKSNDTEPIVFQPVDPSTLHHLNVFFRKSAHILVFGILAVFIYKSTEHRRFPYLTSLLLTILYAILDEWHQSLVPGRTSALKDVLFDTCGACFALLFVFLITRKKQQSRF